MERCPDAVVLIPGLLGSSLVDEKGSPVWGYSPRVLASVLASGTGLDRLKLAPGAPEDGILPRGLIGDGEAGMLPDLFGVVPYGKMLRALRERIALHPDAVLDGCYDWRRSTADAALYLKPRMERHLERWRKHEKGSKDAKLVLICHSMGGLVARFYVDVLGGSAEVDRVITLGTPHLGAVRALYAIDTGRVLRFGMRHTHVRDLLRTLPSIYELAPRYRCVRSSEGLRSLLPEDMSAVGGSRRLAEEAEKMHLALERAPTRGRTEYHLLRGVFQPTLQSVSLNGSGVAYHADREGVDEAGDGTVFRGAAGFGGLACVPLPQSHGQLASSDEAIAFVFDVLAGGLGPPLGAGEMPFGLDAPDVVAAGVAFEVAIIAPDGAQVACRATDAQTGLPADEHLVVGGRVEAVEMTLRLPGLYWVEVETGGASATKKMTLVL